MFEKIKNMLKRLFKKQSLLEEGILKTEVKQTNFKKNSLKTQQYIILKNVWRRKDNRRRHAIREIRKLISIYKEQINMLDREILAKKAKI